MVLLFQEHSEDIDDDNDTASMELCSEDPEDRDIPDTESFCSDNSSVVCESPEMGAYEDDVTVQTDSPGMYTLLDLSV